MRVNAFLKNKGEYDFGNISISDPPFPVLTTTKGFAETRIVAKLANQTKSVHLFTWRFYFRVEK
jgi:hypothetical protein